MASIKEKRIRYSVVNKVVELTEDEAELLKDFIWTSGWEVETSGDLKRLLDYLYNNL